MVSSSRFRESRLQAHGFDVQRGEQGHEGGLSAIEYKKQMENEAREISNKIDDMIKEHNRLEGLDIFESTEKRRVSAHRFACNPVCNPNS